MSSNWRRFEVLRHALMDSLAAGLTQADTPMTFGPAKPIIRRDVERVIFSPLDTPPGLGRGYFFGVARQQDRWIRLACAFPSSPTSRNRRGIDKTDWIKIDRKLYDACTDRRDYRPKHK